jgi:hypothetical protein
MKPLCDDSGLLSSNNFIGDSSIPFQTAFLTTQFYDKKAGDPQT